MLIGLNNDFDMPITFSATCNAPPSMFSYLLPEEKKDEGVKMVASAVLSTTVRAKQRAARKEASKLLRQNSTEQEQPWTCGRLDGDGRGGCGRCAYVSHAERSQAGERHVSSEHLELYFN